MKIKLTYKIVALGVIYSTASPVLAQGPMIYPAQGQSQQQMEQDKYQCYSWAKNNSGFDPMQAHSAAEAPQQPQRGGLFRGAARGAAVGAVGGAIGGDAGKGAAIGAATGAMVGGIRRRGQRKEQAYASDQAEQQYDAAYHDYDRAYAACLEGKGYSVK